MLGDIQKVLAAIEPSNRVLDVGGAAQPLWRANAVIDTVPYEKRGYWGAITGGKEHFTKSSWIVQDFSRHQRFPFADKEFDFVFCSHTLEDIADPFWLCAEMQRVGKRGYIETPSREAESVKGIGGNWSIHRRTAGWFHHRWFLEVVRGELVFTAKYALIHVLPEFQIARRQVEKTYLEFWWEGSFVFREQVLLHLDDALQDLKRFKLAHEADEARRSMLERRLDGRIRVLQQLPFFARQMGHVRGAQKCLRSLFSRNQEHA